MGKIMKRASGEFLPGRLDVPISKSLGHAPIPGYGIAQFLRQTSNDVLQVGEGSLDLALRRLLLNGWTSSEWGASDRMIEATGRVMQTA